MDRSAVVAGLRVSALVSGADVDAAVDGGLVGVVVLVEVVAPDAVWSDAPPPPSYDTRTPPTNPANTATTEAMTSVVRGIWG